MTHVKTLLLVGLVIGLAGPIVQAQSSKDVTPQGMLALRFYKAGLAGDIAGLKACLTDEGAKDLDGPNATRILGQFAGISTAPTITRVKVDKKKNTATVNAVVSSQWRSVPVPASSSRKPDNASVTTVTGTGAYGQGRPSAADPPLNLIYPRTPLETQQALDLYDLATRQLTVAQEPLSALQKTPSFVDEFQMVLVGTEWKIQTVTRKAK